MNLMAQRPMHRPKLTGTFHDVQGGDDPADVTGTAHATAWFVAAGHTEDGATQLGHAQRARLTALTNSEDMATLAQLWSRCAPNTLPGALWRLYAAATWIRSAPQQAAREFGAGKHASTVMEAIAGVADPPGPPEVLALTDDVMNGVAGGDLSITFYRVAAFLKIVAAGRTALLADDAHEPAAADVAALLDTAATLYQAGHAWENGTLS